MANQVKQVVTDRYAIYNDDCIDGISALPDNSVDHSIYSPPFIGLFHYSSSDRDMSNARSYTEFMAHYDFLVREIARVTKPGRMSSVHVMDVPMSNSGKGDRLMDFPGMVIHAHVMCRDPECTAGVYEKMTGECGHGLFDYNCRHSIWKEPLRVRNRTMAKKLAHKTTVDDSTLVGNAGADYLLVFRRKGQNATPVAHPYGFLEYSGSQSMPSDLMKYRGWTGNQIENKYSHWVWRQYASSNWNDVRVDNVLPYRPARDKDDERHVHPLQLDVIERSVTLYTNPGEVVLEPFLGVGSTVYGAVKLGRFGLGWELKETYFKQAVKNMELCETRILDEPKQADMISQMGF